MWNPSLASISFNQEAIIKCHFVVVLRLRWCSNHYSCANMKTPMFSPSTQLLELAALARIRLAVFPASLTFTADIFNIWKLSNNWTEITLEHAPEFHLRDCISDIASCVLMWHMTCLVFIVKLWISYRQDFICVCPFYACSCLPICSLVISPILLNSLLSFYL